MQLKARPLLHPKQLQVQSWVSIEIRVYILRIQFYKTNYAFEDSESKVSFQLLLEFSSEKRALGDSFATNQPFG